MNFSVSNGLNGQLASLRQTGSVGMPANPQNASAPSESQAAVINRVPSNTNTPQGTRLVSENREETGDGAYRLTRTYEREDGRTFTKIEEFALTKRGARKNIIQQNPSGSVTRYEEVLDREPGGNFRRTQRFQDASGEVSTNITTDYKVSDPFILTGGAAPLSYEFAPAFISARGTQLDLQA